VHAKGKSHCERPPSPREQKGHRSAVNLNEISFASGAKFAGKYRQRKYFSFSQPMLNFVQIKLALLAMASKNPDLSRDD